MTAPSSPNVSQNGSVTFSTALGDAITVADISATPPSDSLTLTVVHGALNLASTRGLTFTVGSNNSASMTVTGTLASLNPALNGLGHTPTSGYSGSNSPQISLKDSVDNLTGSATVTITVGLTAPVSSPSSTAAKTVGPTRAGSPSLSAANNMVNEPLTVSAPFLAADDDVTWQKTRKPSSGTG